MTKNARQPTTLARAASTTFLRVRGAEMWARYLAQQRATGAEFVAVPQELFLAGLRIGFEAAFLTILTLEESSGGTGALDGVPPGPVDPVGT